MPDVFVSTDNKGKEVVKQKTDIKKTFFRTLPKEDIKKRLNEERETQSIHIPEGKNVHSLAGHTHNPLSAFCLYPDNVKFISADTKEKIVLILRRHPITNLPWVIVSFVMLIAPFFVMVFPFFDAMPEGMRVVALIIWYLITIAFVLEEFLVWYFNVNIITDERVFDVDFVSMMYRDITEADLDQIQDVTVEVGGTFRTLFGYGDLLIQTAAQIPRVEFEGVPNPDRVAKILRELTVQEEIEKIEGRIR